MVVVIGSPLSAHRDDTVVSALVLFKSELLPQRVVGIHEKVGRVVRPLRGDPGVTLAVSVKGWVLSTSVSRIGRVVLLNCPPLGSQKKSSFSVQRNSIARPSFTVTQVSAVECTRESDAIHADVAGSYFGGNRCSVGRDLFHHVFFLILFVGSFAQPVRQR